MKPHGPKYERETHIRWDEESPEAWVWTASGPVDRKLRKLGYFPSNDDERHSEWRIPKRVVGIRKDRRKK